MSTLNRKIKGEYLTLVLLGSFNPAILHKDWLLKQDIITEDEKRDANIEVVGNELMKVSFNGIQIQCLLDRLQISTSNISNAEQVRDITIQILTTLPHTPISACGINPRCEFIAESEDHWNKIGHTLAPKEDVWNDLLIKPGMNAVSIKGKLESITHNSEVNIQVSPTMEDRLSISIRTNCHFPIPKESIERTQAEFVIDILMTEWQSATSLPRNVVSKILEKIPS